MSGKSSKKSDGLSWSAIFFIILYRALVAVFLPAQENPDEWWQSYEVAYYMVFGKGHLTWEWIAGIRSAAFPSLYAVPYYVLRALHLDTATTIFLAGRLTQGCISATLDCLIFRLGQRIDEALERDEAEEPRATLEKKAKEQKTNRRDGWLITSSVAHTALRLSLLQWYMIYDGARAYANVVEGVCVVLALLQTSYARFLAVGGLACMLRITAVFSLVPMVVLHLHSHVNTYGVVKGVCKIVLTAVLMGAVILALLMCVDYQFYGRWVLTPYEFLRYNILMNVSQYYGVHPIYWYVVSGLPSIAGPHILFLVVLPRVVQLFAGPHVRRLIYTLCFVFAFTMLCHSLIGHKEMRFAFPMLPIILVLVAYMLTCVCAGRSMLHFSLFSNGRGPEVTPKRIRLAYYAFTMVNLGMLVYFGGFYRCGPLSVMRTIRHEPYHYAQMDTMVPCHLIPGHSHIHNKVDSLYTIDCGMEIDPSTSKRKLTHDAIFREHQELYILWRYTRTLGTAETAGLEAWTEKASSLMPRDAPPAPIPDAFIMFRNVAENLRVPFLEPNGCRLHARIFHVHGAGFEPNEDTYVDIWTCLKQ